MNETIFISKVEKNEWRVIDPLSNESHSHIPYYCIQNTGNAENPEIVKPLLKKWVMVYSSYQNDLEQIAVELSIFLIKNGIEANIQLEIPVENERYVCNVKAWYEGKVFTLNISEPHKTKALKRNGK